ncbi:hypothetical protein SAMN05216276_110526 [Streptosporangium subroseum]|uniref:Uncharacterized protein n=1 Tax=Streptosporangium subroseum TaxID=106412 RepID=A0A239PAB1_9ACTN|nr:hypothetical protein [Streptosporangium subroseum]SNT63842.1 hypothetical protein SAMN05216276_110526 [Streptosporangium subroseum]
MQRGQIDRKVANMIQALQKIGVRSSTMYAAGFVSIGLSVASWMASYFGERAGTDRADRWGLFIGEWAPTFFALGVALRIEENHPNPQDLEERRQREELKERADEFVGAGASHPAP